MYFNIWNRRYLGSKTRLISFIDKIVKEKCRDVKTFADIFAGTGCVSWNFNNSCDIIVNDLLYSNYLSFVAFYSCDSFSKTKINEWINKFNSIKVESIKENYFSKNFADTFFSRENCLKIGYIRDKIATLYKNKTINFREQSILITSLIYAADKIANTVGHYDAYRANGALNKELKLLFPNLPKQSANKKNKIFCSNANELVKKIKCDLVYIDPPYNSRQYSDAYHLLENIARWEKPKVYGVAKKMNRDDIKSGYCLKQAPLEFQNLIKNIKSKYILVSYNDMGSNGATRSQAKILDTDIINALKKRGKVTVFDIPFNQFTTGKTKKIKLSERLFLCEVGKFEKQTINIDFKASSSKYSKSPLNYIGGKYKLLPQLIKLFPKEINTFYDLFGGGFNVGCNIEAKKLIYNDSNFSLTELMKIFYKYTSYEIIDKIDEIIAKYNLSNSYKNGYAFYKTTSDKGLGKFNNLQFLKLRNDFNNLNLQNDEKYFYLLVLIIYSFNNQIRFSSKGMYNSPVGKRDFNGNLRKNLHVFCSKIKTKKIDFFSLDFSKMKISGETGTFVYCDPPYYLGCASYNENNGWNILKEKQLLQFLDKLNKNKVKFALSNVIEHKGNQHTLLIEWAKKNKYKIHRINSTYANSNYQIKDKGIKTTEVLITNY